MLVSIYNVCCYSFYLLFSVPVGEIIGIVIGVIVGVILIIIIAITIIVIVAQGHGEGNDDTRLQGVPVNKFLSVFNYLLFLFRIIVIATELLFQRMLRMLIQ